MAKSKLVQFLVVGIVVLVLLSSGEVFAEQHDDTSAADDWSAAEDWFAEVSRIARESYNEDGSSDPWQTVAEQGVVEGSGQLPFEEYNSPPDISGGGGDEEDQESLTLDHFDPFLYFKPGTGPRIGPAGDLVATLKDEDGRGIKGELVFFFVDKEAPPGVDEPGKNLYDILSRHTDYWKPTGKIIKDELRDRKYLGQAYTNFDGEARINLINFEMIDTKKFIVELIFQRAAFEERGKISGTIIAGVYNKETKFIEPQTALEIEYVAMAKILQITGGGRPDDSQLFCKEGCPPCPPLNREFPGKVRVKRALALPHFDYSPVEEGFLLMPGDIIDIDGNTSVEIAWITGDKISVKVPDQLQMGDVPTPYYPPHAEIILLSSAYESGFYTNLERISAPIFGVTVGKGVEMLVELLGPIGIAATLGVDYYRGVRDSFQDFDFSKISVATKIRIRSKVIIDTTGEELVVYNIEGSPDVRTVTGEEVTLKDGQKVSVSADGSMAPVETFDANAVEDEFYESDPAISRGTITVSEQTPENMCQMLPEGIRPMIPEIICMNLLYIIAGIFVLIVLLLLIKMVRRKK